MTSKFFFIVLFLLCLTFFAPLLFNPKILTTQDNDLGRTYIPLFNFIRNSFYLNKSLPLWRSGQMMGETVIGNPVSSPLYPANILFLVFPVNFAAILYLFIHFFLAGLFTFFLARSFKLSSLSSAGAAIFYAFSTKMLVHMAAGHITMIAAFSYMPLIFLAVRKILTDYSFSWIIIGSFALALMYIAYPTILYYGAFFIFVYLIYYFFSHPLFKILKKLKNLALLFIFALGLVSIQLLPHLEFAPLSTRSLLKLEDVALPLWNLKKFIFSLGFPYSNFSAINHEEFLYLGIVPTFFSFFGFLKLRVRQKIFLFSIGFLTLIFIAGLSTPFFKLAYNMLPFLKYSRVTTRLWFVVALVASLLSAFAFENIRKKSIVYFAICFFVVESFFIGAREIIQTPKLDFGNQSLYQYISQDKEIFRVYCTTYCFNPQLLYKYKIQILAGENPIQNANFVNFLSKAGNYNFDKFAVIFPPYQVWQKENPPIPSADLLGLANVKYVASTYPISSKDFNFVKKFENIFLYYNTSFKKRVYFESSNDHVKISKYSPNDILIDFNQKPFERSLIFSENFYPGWSAYANHTNLPIFKKEKVFREVVVPKDTNRLEFKYSPDSFIIGKTISLSIVFVFLLYFWYIRQKKIK